MLGCVLGVEALLASLYLDGEALNAKHGVLVVLLRTWGAWAARFGIAFAALFATFAFLKYKAALMAISDCAAESRVRVSFLASHVLAIGTFGVLASQVFGKGPDVAPVDLLAAGWLLAALAAAMFLAVALVPWFLWVELIRATGYLWMHASAAAATACWIGMMSRLLWTPATKLTYSLVKLLLQPWFTNMVVQPEVARIGTRRFTVIVSAECSGLEGAALLLIFGALWLVLFRGQIRFPHALALLPAAIVSLFLLNAARIAALVVIGHAGARDIAVRGFHSQAGWIAFNTVAFAFSVAARRLPWFSKHGSGAPRSIECGVNPASAFLVPFLMILAAGMISRAFSGAFEWLYGLRLAAAAGALWVFRERYRELDWRCGWTAAVAGVAVFFLWIGPDWRANANQATGMPAPLAAAPVALRLLWILCRVVSAVVTVPVAEELAFRGYLLRLLISADFEKVPFRAWSWFSMLASSLAFGLLHGERWPAGTLAGVVYALAVQRSGRLAEAVWAHAITNFLLAVYILRDFRWDLW